MNVFVKKSKKINLKVEKDLFEYSVLFYSIPPHTALNYQPPVVFTIQEL